MPLRRHQGRGAPSPDRFGVFLDGVGEVGAQAQSLMLDMASSGLGALANQTTAYEVRDGAGRVVHHARLEPALGPSQV